MKEKKKDFERGGNIWVEPLREWVLDMKLANFLSSHDDFVKTKKLVQKIGTNHSVRDKSARFGATPPCDFIAQRKRFLPHRPPSANKDLVMTPQEVRICARRQTRTADTWFFKPVL